MPRTIGPTTAATAQSLYSARFDLHPQSMSMSQVARVLAVSRQRVSQLAITALETVRANLE